MKRAFLQVLCFAVGLFGMACWPKSKMVSIGPEAKADLVVYFKKEASYEDVNNFWEKTFFVPHPEGRGSKVTEGIGLLAKRPPVQGHEAMSVTFRPNITQVQRENLKAAIKSSPIVYKVLENVAPADVREFDLMSGHKL